MKNFYFFLLLFTSLTLCSFDSQAQNTWQYKGDFDGFIGLYDSQHFVIEPDVYGNRIYEYTRDGGETYQDLGINISSPKFLVHVEYLNPDTMRAVIFTGSNYELYESTDGGENFDLLSSAILPDNMFAFNQAPQLVSYDESESLLSCRVLYNNEGDFETVQAVLLRTTDGGNSWNFATADPLYFADNYDIEIYKDGHVVAASDFPQYMEISTDRGQTFTATSSFPPITSTIQVAYDGNQNIWATDIIGANNARAYYSSDNGNTWNPWDVLSDADDVRFIKPSTLLVYGTEDFTSISTDGGLTFSAVTFSENNEPLGPFFIHVGGDEKTYYGIDGSAQLWVLPTEEGLGVNDMSNENTINIYPNPAKNQINIPNYSGKVEAFNTLGQLIKSTTIKIGEPVDISDLPQGMFIIKLKNGVTRVLKK